MTTRLNKDIREQLVKATLEKWEARNPKPSTQEACRALLLAAIEYNLNNEKVEYAGDGEVPAGSVPTTIKDTQEATAFYKKHKDKMQLPGLEPTVKTYFSLNRVMEDGTSSFVMSLLMPKDVVDLTSLVTTGVGSERDTDLYDEEVPAVGLVTDVRPALLIPHNFKPYKDYTKRKRMVKDWEVNRKKIKETLETDLDTYRTSKQLEEGWPKMAKLLSQVVAKKQKECRAVMVTHDRIDEECGL